jgi:hypothetical protein
VTAAERTGKKGKRASAGSLFLSYARRDKQQQKKKQIPCEDDSKKSKSNDESRKAKAATIAKAGAWARILL